MPPRLTTFRGLSPSFLRTSNSHNHAITSSSSFLISFFSTTSKLPYARSNRGPTHYETLNVPVTATAAEIKKQFYALSLKHHPDHNRSDSNATERFATISSAYQVLGDSTKRARYDREHGISLQSTHSSGVSGQHPMGSHSSASAQSSYAGSRPASGLSKRRTAFRGPPPSFYAHGGYGATSGSRASPGASYPGTDDTNATGSGTSKGSSGDEDPTSFINNNPVWHFNARGHYKTQAAEDMRRKQRRSRQMEQEHEFMENQSRGYGGSGSFIFRFVVVSSILIGTASIMGGFLRMNSSRSSSEKKNSQALARRHAD